MPQIGVTPGVFLIADISATSRAPVESPFHCTLSVPAAAYFVSSQVSQTVVPNPRPKPSAEMLSVRLPQLSLRSVRGLQSAHCHVPPPSRSTWIHA